MGRGSALTATSTLQQLDIKGSKLAPEPDDHALSPDVQLPHTSKLAPPYRVASTATGLQLRRWGAAIILPDSLCGDNPLCLPLAAAAAATLQCYARWP